MNITEAYYIGTHPDSFRSGEAAKIEGVVFADSASSERRACFQVKYGDGRIDYSPISDVNNYRLVSGRDIDVIESYRERKTIPDAL
jgi:hypothetical protein